MNKLSNPFKDKAIRLTQTSHNNLGGHSDFSLVRAIDCNAEPFDNRIYAEGDGVVIASVNAKNPNSYLHIKYDGMPSHILREFVHCRPSVAKGARVKRGQLVGTLEPYRASWYGTGIAHHVHLHWSFLNTNKTGAPNPFNYLDRTTKVTTNATVIKNHRTWFNTNGTFNWSSFGDYKLDIKTTAPVDPCAVQNAKIKDLEGQITQKNKELVALGTSLNSQVSKLETLLDSQIETLKKSELEVKNYKLIEDKLLQDINYLLIEMESEKKNARDLAIEVLELQQIVEDQKDTIEGLKVEKNCNLENLKLGDFITWVGLKFGIGQK